MGLSFEAQQRKRRETNKQIKKIRLGTLSPTEDRGASGGGFKTRKALQCIQLALDTGDVQLSKLLNVWYLKILL